MIAALLSRVARRIGLLVHSRRHEREMDEEMRFHLEMEARDLTRQGLSEAEAARTARLTFGGVEHHKETGRDARGVRLVEDLGQDIRYALRQYTANPTFTLATMLTLSLGIGASTVMFAFTRMTPVPFENADRLVYIRQYGKQACPGCRNIAGGNALALRSSPRVFASVSLMDGGTRTVLRGRERSEVIRSQSVTYDFFNTVDVAPLLGRTFLPSDTLRDQPPTAVISEALWRTRFGGDSSIVGRDIVLDGIHHVLRGVIPKGNEYPDRTDAWTILHLSSADMNQHAGALMFQAIARLRDGANLAQAQAEVKTISDRLAIAFPADFPPWTLGVEPLSRYDGFSDDRRSAIFLTAVGFVLLVACANLGGLLIARLTRRRRELAVRVAMGAGAARVTRQLLTETALLCLTAAVLGVGLAHFGLQAVLNAVPDSAAPPGWTRVHIDWGAFTFALALGSLAALAIGLWPSIRFSRPELNVELRDGVRAASYRGASGGERLRRALVVGEIALSLILLSAAALLVRSVGKLAKAPVGFSGDHVLTMSLQLPSEIDGKRVESLGYFDRLAQEVAHVGGVTNAGAVAFLPLARTGWSATLFQVEGRPPLKGSGGTRTQTVTPGYFATFKIPILRGHAFTDADADTSRKVAMINATTARRFFADDDPIGKTLVLYGGARMTVVGIVGDVKQEGAQGGVNQEILMPAATTSRRSMTLVVRTAGDPADLSSEIVKAIVTFDPNLAINRIRTMDSIVDDFMAPFRVQQGLMLAFAVIAIFIATMGLYATMSYTVASRMREFGVRLALGATGQSLRRLVLGQGLRLAGVGIALGTVGAVAATRVMRSMLYDVTPGDPLTIGVVGLGICAVALAAGALPARRAMKVDPVSSLRQE